MKFVKETLLHQLCKSYSILSLFLFFFLNILFENNFPTYNDDEKMITITIVLLIVMMDMHLKLRPTNIYILAVCENCKNIISHLSGLCHGIPHIIM